AAAAPEVGAAAAAEVGAAAAAEVGAAAALEVGAGAAAGAEDLLLQPVAMSASPAIAAMAARGADIPYLPFHVEPGERHGDENAAGQSRLATSAQHGVTSPAR